MSFITAFAQTTVDTYANFTQKLEKNYQQQNRGTNLINLNLENGLSLKGEILSKVIKNNEIIYEGIIDGQKAGFTFSLNNGKLSGEIILSEEEKAFSYTSDAQGNVIITETSIHQFVCVDKELPIAKNQRTSADISPTLPQGTDVNKLESYPNAPAVVYLDFDGHLVTDSWWANRYNSGQSINCTPANLTDDQMYEIWEVVSEDFRPFNINITTDPSIFDKVATTKRQRVVITRTSNWQTLSSTGIARIGAFSVSDSPVFSFPSGLSKNQDRAEVTSHEIGHALGLTHDGATGSNSTNYYRGHGEWCTIMGAGYSDDITQWSKGEYANSNNTQDDIAIITNTKNSFGFRTDDHGNTQALGTAITESPSKTITATQNSGVIEKRTDVDVWLFGTSGGKIDLTINAFHVKPNLDVEAKLYDSNDQLIASSDVSGLFHATFNQTLTAGVYYVIVDGVGYKTASDGYTDYGSLGHYDISGSIENFYSTLTQSPIISITKPLNNATFEMSAFTPISLSATASDLDGTVKEVAFLIDGEKVIATLQGNDYVASWTPKKFGTIKIVGQATDDLGAIGTNEISITITEKLLNNNIQLIKIDDSKLMNCSTTLDLSIIVKNNGKNAVSQFTIESYVNNNLVNSTNHSTNLASLKEEIITLDPLAFNTSGDQEIMIKVILANDENIIDNEMTITKNLNFGKNYMFYISTRSINPAISWTIKNGQNQLIADEKTTSTIVNDLTVQEFCLADGCFDMTITDPFTDGSCTVPAWTNSTEYCVGKQVSHNGIVYESEWCTRKEPGTAQFIGWKEIGKCNVKYDEDKLGVINSSTQNSEFELTVANFPNPTSTKTICSGIVTANQNDLTNELTVYPNPFTNELQFNEVFNGKITLYNQLGELVLTTENTNLINTTDLINGIYFLKMENDTTVYQIKVIKN